MVKKTSKNMGRGIRAVFYISVLATLSACLGSNSDWTSAEPGAVGRAVAGDDTLSRPRPDGRGIISYPNYTVVVSNRGETVSEVAARVGWPVEELARYNGMLPNTVLRNEEVIVIPRPASDAGFAENGQTDFDSFTNMAANAIDNASSPPVSIAPLGAAEPLSPAPAAVSTGPEPIRHRVAKGETAYSIASLYNVPVDRLAEWNGLGSDLAVREEQIVLIPVTLPAPANSSPAISTPGAGSSVPAPPSASSPLPWPQNQPSATASDPVPQAPDNRSIGAQASAANSAPMSYPVTGQIIREYAKGTNEGIDISAPAGTPVVAADDGVVAAISEDTQGIKILVIRHLNNLLTVYTNIDNIRVTKGDPVLRDQPIAQVQEGTPSFVHFEVRDGLASIDPAFYLERS